MGENVNLKLLLYILFSTIFLGCAGSRTAPENGTNPEQTIIFGVPPPFSHDKIDDREILITGMEPDPEKAGKGDALFKIWCRGCHETESKTSRFGPSLKDLFKQETLPMSSRKVTAQNIRVQIRTPFRFMPPFPNLSEEEIEQIIEYLRTI